jgi:hypothetical protein
MNQRPWLILAILAGGLAAVIFLIRWSSDDGDASLADIRGSWQVDPAATAWSESRAGDLPPPTLADATGEPAGALARAWTGRVLTISGTPIEISGENGRASEILPFTVTGCAIDLVRLRLPDDREVAILIDQGRLLWREGAKSIQTVVLRPVR